VIVFAKTHANCFSAEQRGDGVLGTSVSDDLLMVVSESSVSEQLALDVVMRLNAAGHTALWAGGCVRDRLLGRTPCDYDVATSADPDEIRKALRGLRTLSIGAGFGVIAVLGPRRAGKVEVATFRRDIGYSDGRHPDRVEFSAAEDDAQRRDFTINGIFYDPIVNRVIDYVGGCQDLQARLIRAIGDPHARFAEDKLRLLRAIRFAAQFDFALDEQTKAAIAADPDSVNVVSAERIAEEMRRMLIDASRSAAVRLLRETRLLESVLPEATFFMSASGEEAWQRTLKVLDDLRSPPFPVALAALVRELSESSRNVARKVCNRWKLSNAETDLTTWLIGNEAVIRTARNSPWPSVQRLLVHSSVGPLLQFASAVARVLDGHNEAIEFCRTQLELPVDQLDPPPLITGDDLIAHGVPRGKEYRLLLTAVRDAQLERRIVNRDQAISLVDELRRNAKTRNKD
jgi:tRNA nucleotidyltransferase/poly(A) polymerase